MGHRLLKTSIPAIMFSIILVSGSVNFANADLLPEWIKNNALWYGQGNISETEFLNMIKFLLESEVIKLESVEEIVPEVRDATVMIPNGNFDVSSSAFYMPLNLEISAGTTVTWTNDDSVPHTIQSQDEFGNVIALFNSAPLNTGDKFEYTFEEAGVYNYFCSFHPWRVGVVTVK
jgi:plastocyanin